MLCLWEICNSETMTEHHRPCEEHIFWLFWSEARKQDKAQAHTKYAKHALKAKAMEVWKEDIHAFAVSVV